MRLSMPFNPVVVAPTFNNAGTVLDVLSRLDALGLPTIVVNDGSADETAAVLAEWQARPRGHRVEVLTHPRNRGKAAALRTGFAAAADAGYTHAATIDTDGQLDPEQVPDLLAVARRDPRALVLGVRDDAVAGQPGRSRLGRRASNLLVWMESGARVSDSQCGLRVYPLALVRSVRCGAGRYGFETEIITRSAWAGWPVAEAPVRCRYFDRAARVSHFRPWRDSVRGGALHARLVARAMWPWSRRAAPADAEVAPPVRSLRDVGRWLSPRAVWRQIKHDRPDMTGRTHFAGALAIGAFIANLPIYGLQSVAALYTARRLNLNPLGVLAGSQLSMPPFGVVLGIAAVAVGHLLLRGSLPTWAELSAAREGVRPMLQTGAWFLAAWAVGSVIVGLLSLLAVFLSAEWVLRKFPPKAEGPAGEASPDDAPGPDSVPHPRIDVAATTPAARTDAA